MKWLRTIIVFDKGNVVAEQDWAAVHESYVRSTEAIDHPSGSGGIVRPELWYSGLGRGERKVV